MREFSEVPAFGSRRSTLPLGLDISADSLSIAALQHTEATLRLCSAKTIELPTGRDAADDLTISRTLRRLLPDLGTRERRAVLAAPQAELVQRVFTIPAGMGRREATRAARLEASTLSDWPAADRVVALDPIPDERDRMLLSVARRRPIARLVSIATAAGLKPIAVDVPACAWRRIVHGADAVLDCASGTAELIVFGTPIGMATRFAPRLLEDRIATNVRSVLAQARREGIADVQRLAVCADDFHFESIAPLLSDDGVSVVRLNVAGVNGPPWAFAFGLATWSVAEQSARA